jgi:hypothetical protein
MARILITCSTNVSACWRPSCWPTLGTASPPVLLIDVGTLVSRWSIAEGDDRS